MIGERFYRLVVISEDHLKKGKGRYYLCQCDCGNTKVVFRGNLKSGHTKSCGCFMREQTSKANTTHGLSKPGKLHPIYHTWASMKKRCNNPKSKDFVNYGGRGIYVCPEWEVSFENFLRDMGPTWVKGLTIDREDNDGPYMFNNCRWVDRGTQSNNRRDCSEAISRGVKKAWDDGKMEGVRDILRAGIGKRKAGVT